MNTLFIESKSKLNFSNFKIFKNLPKNLAIVYSIQFKSLAEKIKSELSKSKQITLFSQVLGCSNPDFPKKTEAILLVGNGKFHAVSLAYESGLKVYLLESDSIKEIEKSEVELISKKEKSALIKYLNSEKIGIIVSTKPGQQRFSRALEFKKKTKNKKSYLFLANDINVSEFENFGLNSYVNTACPRMDLVSSSLININKVINL